MQLLARRIPVGKTKMEKEDSFAKLREAIREKFDGVILEYSVRIESVDWKSDTLRFKTQSPIHKYKPSARLSLDIGALGPIAIPMSREDAGNLSLRKPLQLRCKLKFIGEKWIVVGRSPARLSVFRVSSIQYKALYSLGTFVTEDYSVSIGDEEIFALHPEQEAK